MVINSSHSSQFESKLFVLYNLLWDHKNVQKWKEDYMDLEKSPTAHLLQIF